MTISLSLNRGDLIPEKPQQVIVTRGDDSMMIFAKRIDKKGKVVRTPAHSLNDAQFSLIAETLTDFYKLAVSEISINEHLSSLSESEREKKLEAYSETHGQLIEGFGSATFVVQFHSDSTHKLFTDSFAESKSVDAFRTWIQSLPESQKR
jgi:hypothetical protein